jgi:hypothetical protein
MGPMTIPQAFVSYRSHWGIDEGPPACTIVHFKT